jgi:isocitrate/isopropylmalate dehydrogenase
MARTIKVAVTAGDGIGLEVVPEGIKILKVIQEFTDYEFKFTDAPAGGQVWKDTGVNLSDKSFDIMKKSDAILFGAIGLPDLPFRSGRISHPNDSDKDSINMSIYDPKTFRGFT